MEEARAKRHYFLRTLILIGFTSLLAELIITDRLSHYLAPRLHMFSYVTLGILALLTLVSLRQAITGTNAYDCDCEDAHKLPRSLWRSVFGYGLFLLPLAMAFLLPDQLLGSDLAEKRGITLLSNDVKKLAEAAGKANTEADARKNDSPPVQSEKPGNGNGSASAEEQPPMSSATEKTAQSSGKQSAMTDEGLRQKFATGFGDFYADIAVSLYKQPVIRLDETVFLDGLTTMELYAKEFAGKELETLGFVYRQPDFTPQQFVVARFSVTCCTADANVFGILVENGQADRWAKDSWVKVRGRLELRQVDGYDMLVLKASKVEQVKAPKDPYVYYSYDPAGTNASKGDGL